jgi:hypothetical protein
MIWALLACTKPDAESDAVETDDSDVPIDRNAVWTPILLETFEPLARWQDAERWKTTPPACPSTVANGETTTYTGGCVDGDGLAWTGTLVRTDISRGTRLVYDGFGTDSGLDGEMVWFADADRLEVDLAARDAAGSVLRAWTTGYTFESAIGARAAWARAGKGEGSFSGRLTTADGLYDVAGSIGHDGACGREPDRGEVLVSGFRAGTLTLNGAAICDGCVPLADEYGIGEICPFLAP